MPELRRKDGQASCCGLLWIAILVLAKKAFSTSAVGIQPVHTGASRSPEWFNSRLRR